LLEPVRLGVQRLCHLYEFNSRLMAVHVLSDPPGLSGSGSIVVGIIARHGGAPVVSAFR